MFNGGLGSGGMFGGELPLPPGAIMLLRNGIDIIGISTRTVQKKWHLLGDNSGYLASATIVGTETVTSKEGTAAVTFAAGRVNVGVGTLWSLVLSNGSRYEMPTMTGAASAVMYDVSGNGRHLTLTGYTLATAVVESLTIGSDWLNQIGCNTGGAKSVTPGYLIPFGAGYREASRIQDGGIAGYSLNLDGNTDFVNSPTAPFDTLAYLGDGWWNAITDGSSACALGSAPIIPVVTGRWYLFSLSVVKNNEYGNTFQIRGSVDFGSATYDLTIEDYEESIKAGQGNIVKKYWKATVTGNVATRFTYSSGQAANITFGDMAVQEIIPSFLDNSIDDNELCFWGDSITAGWFPWISRMYVQNGYIYNGGVGGETSTQIKARMLADTARYGKRTIICAGTNNYSSWPNTVLQDNIDMVAALGHDNYLILSPLGASTIPNGSEGRTNLNLTKAALSGQFGSKYVDIEQVLIDNYDPDIPQDVTDIGNGVTPSSLRSDIVHPNYWGGKVIADHLGTNYPEIFQFFPAAISSDRVKYSFTDGKWPSAPAIIERTGVDNAVYDASGVGVDFGGDYAAALAALASLADDQYLWGGTKAAVLYSENKSAQAVRIKHAVGDI